MRLPQAQNQPGHLLDMREMGVRDLLVYLLKLQVQPLGTDHRCPSAIGKRSRGKAALQKPISLERFGYVLA